MTASAGPPRGGTSSVDSVYDSADFVHITFYDPVRFPPLSPCEKECTHGHEASHARTCREFGILITVSAQNTDEALAYRTEALCLLRAASKRSIDVDEEFPDLRPIPIP